MPDQNVVRGNFCLYLYSIFLFVGCFSIYFATCLGFETDEVSKSSDFNSISLNDIKAYRLYKRSSGKSCTNSTDCITDIRGSVCVQNTCVCPQGFLPLKQGGIGCFQVGKHLGNYCDHSSQCGEELTCRNHVCLCPDGFQLYHSHGINLCLLWHKPTRLVDRCRTNEDCTQHDVNTVCKKRWCQCNNGYQLFETMLYGRKQKCFKTLPHQCMKSSQCSKYSESPEQHCMCYYGVCHCLTDLNFTNFDIPTWGDKPNWYQRWKKDLILATRLLFITVILFFVPCFIYVTLGIRERGRSIFSHFVQPSRSPVIHYSQRRMSGMRPLHSYRGLSTFNNNRNSGTAHHVEISMHTNGVNSRLVDSRSRMPIQPPSCDVHHNIPYLENNGKEEDPPPSYEEIMRKEGTAEEPPPPYRAL